MTKTGFMTIYCSECREGFPMYPDRRWFNFSDDRYRDPIGFCSAECLDVFATRMKYKD
jgi:hypothetical protein